jgi:DNA-binding XRE family transcriptional regulator|nr:MAG TPA: helix-turn-helix domain protein [Caudoviricetes sp.]
MTAGEKIRKRRIELHVKQKDLANRIGVTAAFVSAIENGKRRCKERWLFRIATVLDCTIYDLQDDEPKGMVDPTNDDFGAVCNCAVRYCLGRRSYMPSLVCGYLTPLLSKLDDNTLFCFKRDIEEHKKDGFDFGDSCDYETWKQFYTAVQKEIDGRSDNG